MQNAMTPEQRAEKIWDTMRGLDNVGSKISFIAAQISEAEREAVDNLNKQVIAGEEILATRNYQEGFASAREKAAGISLRHFEETEYHDDTTCDCGGVIAERIRAMEAGK